jgi:hypothetical protein
MDNTFVGAPFNSEFYTVAATVIPLFFIALLLPNGFLFEYWRQVESRHNNRGSSHGGRKLWSQIRRHSLYLVTVLPPMIVVVAGSVAEICSILALNCRHANAFEHAVVLVYFFLLPAVTAVGIMTLVMAESQP